MDVSGDNLVSRVREETYLQDRLAALLLAVSSGLIFFDMTAEWPVFTHDGAFHIRQLEALTDALRDRSDLSPLVPRQHVRLRQTGPQLLPARLLIIPLRCYIWPGWTWSRAFASHFPWALPFQHGGCTAYRDCLFRCGPRSSASSVFSSFPIASPISL